MADDERISRRRVLEGIAAGGVTGLAGCGDGPGETPTGRNMTDVGTPTEGPGTESPTETQGGGGGGPCPAVEYVLNTGFDQDAGNVISPCNDDDDWEITADQVQGSASVGQPADVIEPHSAWADAYQDSGWISVACDGNPGLSGNKELFEYTYCFCLNEGFNRPELDVRLRADDAIEEITLNGNSLPFSGNGTYSGADIQETYTSPRYFQAGENCLSVVVRDTGAVITGLNLAGTMTAENADCECEPGQCDLAIEKTHEGPFEFGETGTYVIEVCNEGDGPCNRAAEIRDDLPDGVTFDSAFGQGWRVNRNGGTIRLNHDNRDGLAPGECLPPVEIEVQVAPFEEFPEEGGLSNCAELITGGQHSDNDRDCTTPCISGERTFQGGVRDDFDQGNDEPASPSEGLQANWGGNLGDFDDGTINTHFGHTFDELRPSPVVGEICAATLELCLRPEPGTSLSDNDILGLGVWADDGTKLGGWGHKIGNHRGETGLFDTRWHASETGARCLTLDLSDLPNGNRTNDVLPLLNTHNRISIHVQDDTSVDFATLDVTYCCEGEEPGECDLAVRKSTAGEFRFGERGSYTVEVCNRGEGDCDGPVSVTDRLPEGIRYVDSKGSGWECDPQGGEVVCKHPNSGGLSPGECLPVLELVVEVPPEQRWPKDEHTARNCVELRHDGRMVAEDCIEHEIATGGGAHGCVLSIGKTVEDPFEFGGAGAYGFRVCNEGDEVCQQEVLEITDELPDGFEFRGGSGNGWDCQLADPDRNLVSCTYENPSLEPGECLPQSVWEIEVVSEEEWPHDSNRVENCAQLSTARERVDEDCIEHEVE